jgi:glycosyltransferase involved in cell wall biosynthesis
MSPDSLHVAVVADSRHPLRQPFAGGMQAMTWHLVQGLRAHGVAVTVFAGPGSDECLGAEIISAVPLGLSDAARRDVSMVPEAWLREHHAYLDLMLHLAKRRDIKLVHNNSLHHLPVAMAGVLGRPLVTTLHSPPTPWLESAVRISSSSSHHLAAVSQHTADAWHASCGLRPHVVPNGIDLAAWPLGDGGSDLVWMGRLVPEKAPHTAMDIARRAGRRLRLAGPRHDESYWEEMVKPRLTDRVQYVGHLDQDALARLVGSSSACLVTPEWDEPYGLVAAEALACGTPVLALDRGALRELVQPDCGRLVAQGDIEGAVRVLPDVESLDRRDVRAAAVRACSLQRTVEGYLELYATVLEGRAA